MKERKRKKSVKSTEFAENVQLMNKNQEKKR